MKSNQNYLSTVVVIEIVNNCLPERAATKLSTASLYLRCRSYMS